MSLDGKISFHRHDGEGKRSPSSHPKLSLSLKRQFAVLEREDADQYSLVKVPICTEQSNNWAANNFEEWWRDYNRRNLGSEIRGDILESKDCQELDEVLSTFTVEIRKVNGKKYPPCTLYQLLSRLHRYILLLHADKDLPQFCSSKNTFRRLHRMLDNLLKKLRVEGIG